MLRRRRFTKPVAASLPAMYSRRCSLACAGTRLNAFFQMKSPASNTRPAATPCRRYLLNFPILIPALLGAMQLTSALVAGKPITDDNSSWLKMLIGFDAMYTAVSVALVEVILVS